MPLIENDYDVFGVLFDVRTQGLDSVKGVVQGLISTEEWASKAKGSLVDVKDALDFMKKSGVSAQDAMRFLNQGGSDDLIQFSAKAQRAAQEVSKYVDEFKALEARRKQTTSRIEELQSGPSGSNTAQTIAQLNGELTRTRGQMGVIMSRLSQRREDDMSTEAIGLGNGMSALQRTIKELGATQPTFNLQNPSSARPTVDDFDLGKELTQAQKILREQASGIAEEIRNVKQQLAAGQKPWYGEKGGKMRTGAVLDSEGRPQPGSRAKGSESTGEAVDQVMTEGVAKRLTDQKIALEALHKRMLQAAGGDSRQADVVLREMTALAAHSREEAALAVSALQKQLGLTSSTTNDVSNLAGSKSESAMVMAAYRRVIQPERTMQRATREIDNVVQQHVRQTTGQSPDVSTILYPGRVTKTLDEQTAKLRAEALAIERHKALNPEDTDAMMAVKERYGKLMQKARARSETEPFQHQGEELYEEDPAITALRARQEIELERAKLGSTEFEKQRLQESIDRAAKVAQTQQRQASYRKLFGDKRIEDIHSEIDESTELTTRQKNAKHNDTNIEYARWLRAGKKSNEAIDVERDVAVRQKAAREENRSTRSSMFDERREQRMAMLRGEVPSAQQAKSAYVFDIDKTLLSHAGAPPASDVQATQAWLKQANAAAIATGKALYDEAIAGGHEVHLITARASSLREATEQNLKAAGMGQYTSLTLTPHEGGFKTYDQVAEWKAKVRKDLIDSGRDVLKNVGDSPSDFQGGGYRQGVRIVDEATAEHFDPDQQYTGPGKSGSTAQATRGAGGNPYQEVYQKAVKEAREALRGAQVKGRPIGGGSGLDEENPTAFTRPGGFSASYERMLDAERQLNALRREGIRNYEDVEAKTRKLADTTATYQARIKQASDQATAAQQNYENVAVESVGRIAAKRAEADETRRIEEVKYQQAQDRTQLAIDSLELKRAKIAASKPNSFAGQADRARFDAHKDELLSQVDRQIQGRMEIGGVNADGTPREGLRSIQFKRSQNQAAFQLSNFEESENARVAAAANNAQKLADRELAIRATLGNRIQNLNADLTQTQTREAEDFVDKRDRAEKKLADARVKYQRDAEKAIDTEFSRKGETLQDTLLRTRNPQQFTAAQAQEEEVLRSGAGGRRAPISVLEQAEPTINVAENQSRSYSKLRDQITAMYAGLEDKRRSYARTEESELQHLATLRIKAEAAPPELRGHANDALEAAQIQAQERLIQAQTKVADAQQQTQAKSVKAHQQYYQNIAHEQESAERAMRASSNQSLLNLTAQFAGAISIVRGFVQEMVLYSARTETMKIVTEQMAKTNGINSEALNHQILAIKSLNITTQEAHETVQRMIFAQLDVARATNLARVAQDAATISGENSSETLQKIITGITTGQTRILHYMGLQVSMNQVLRQAREELGREPTEVEKRTALLNAVLEQGSKIAGNYDAAMLTAGKQMLSLKRQFQEAQNAVGQEFQPALLSVISLMSRFSNIARENSTEFAQLTRVVAGLVAGLLILQGVQFATDSASGFLGKFAGGLKLRPVAAAVEGAEAATGIKGFLSRIPVGNWVTAGIAGAAAIGTYAGSKVDPISGVKNTISSIKSQNQIDIAQLDIQHRTGELDDLTYSQSIKRFTDQDAALATRARAQIAQVWIDRAKKAAQLQESFLGDYKNDTREQSFWERIKTAVGRNWTSLPIVGSPETFTDNGMTRLEGALGLHPGQSIFSAATTGANSKSIDKQKEYQLMLDRLRKKIQEGGDQVTEAGVYTVTQQLTDFDTWRKGVLDGAKAKLDPLYNVKMKLEQEASNLDDMLLDKVRKSKEKIEELAERMITRGIVDPVEKLRHEMNFEVKKFDVGEQIKPIYEDLTALGLGPGQSNQDYDKYAAARRRRDSLHVKQEQVDTYQNIVGAYGPGGSSVSKNPDENRRKMQDAIQQAGLSDTLPKVQEYRALSTQIGASETSAFKTKFDTEQLVKTNDEEKKKILDAYAPIMRSELLERDLAKATKTVEFNTQVANLSAPPGGGIAQQRQLIQASSTAQVGDENEALRQRVELIKKDFQGTEQANQVRSEQIKTNNKLLEIDRQRVLALLQINQQEQQNANAYDISKIEARLALEEAIVNVQLIGSDQVMARAVALRDLQLKASEEQFKKDQNYWEYLKRNQGINTNFKVTGINNLGQQAEQAKNELQTILERTQQRSGELRLASATGPYQQDTAIRQNYEEKKQYLALEFQLNKDNKEKLRELDKQAADADFEYLKQRMDLYKTQLEEGRKLAGDVFDTITSSGHPGENAQKFFTGLFKNTEKTIFQNVLGNTFTGLQSKMSIPGQGTMDHPTLLGKALQGTMFGMRDDPKKEIAALQERVQKEREAVEKQVAAIKTQGQLVDSTEKSVTAMDRLRDAIDKLRDVEANIKNLKVTPTTSGMPGDGTGANPQTAKVIYGPRGTLAGGRPVPGMVGVDQATLGNAPASQADASEGLGITPEQQVALDEQRQKAKAGIQNALNLNKFYWQTPDFLKAAGVAGSDAYAVAKSTVTSPIAMSRVTRTPIYPVHDPTGTQAGFQVPGKRGIFVDPSQPDLGDTIKHESVHDLLSQSNSLGTLAADKTLQTYTTKIRKGLTESSGALYSGISDKTALSEGMAYGSQAGTIPGLGIEESRAFLLRANSDLDPKTREKFLRLSKPFDQPISYGRSGTLSNEDILNNEGIGDEAWRKQAAMQAKMATLGKMYWRTPPEAKTFANVPAAPGQDYKKSSPFDNPAFMEYMKNVGGAVPPTPAAPSPKDDIDVAAAKYGMDPATMHRIAQIESGGKADAVNPKSGAAGMFQFMPATAQAYGLKNPLDPAAASDAAARMMRDNAYTLSQKLNRPVTPADLYLAQQQGPAGAAALINNPDKNAADAISEFYKDPKTAKKAIVDNGGTADMTAQQFTNLWSKKFYSDKAPTDFGGITAPIAPPSDYVEPVTIPAPYEQMATPAPYQYRASVPDYGVNIPKSPATGSSSTESNAFRIANAGLQNTPMGGGAHQVTSSGMGVAQTTAQFLRDRHAPQDSVTQADKNLKAMEKKVAQGKATQQDLALAQSADDLAHANVDPGDAPHLPKNLPAWLRPAVTRMDKSFGWIPRERQSSDQMKQHAASVAAAQANYAASRAAVVGHPDNMTAEGLVINPDGTKSFPPGTKTNEAGQKVLPSGAVVGVTSDGTPGLVYKRASAPATSELAPGTTSGGTTTLKLGGGDNAAIGLTKQVAAQDVSQGVNAAKGPNTTAMPYNQALWNVLGAGVGVAAAGIGALPGSPGASTDSGDSGSGGAGGGAPASGGSVDPNAAQANGAGQVGAAQGAGASGGGGGSKPQGDGGSWAGIGAEVGALGGSALGAAQEFNKGGLYHDLGALQALTPILSMIPVVGAFAPLIGAGAGLVRAIMGDPRENYKKLQEARLKQQKYYDPDVESRITDTSGQLISFDAAGRPRQNGLPESGPIAEDPGFSAGYINQSMASWANPANDSAASAMRSPAASTPTSYASTPGYTTSQYHSLDDRLGVAADFAGPAVWLSSMLGFGSKTDSWYHPGQSYASGPMFGNAAQADHYAGYSASASTAPPAPTIAYGDSQVQAQTLGSGNKGTGGTVHLNVNVQTMDSRSFMDNSGKIASAMQHQLALNHPVSGEILQIARQA